ncbi:hypothetical protein RRG08_042792 [Elysia crispata]|uniref:Uncharacterized protein n=1 Tax=Elysia crispata TaxID=231223 RepID=A0AAE0YCD3_9GAST|nr:hypothetical protein RRG08_042792 [Elysia crispata]
MQESHNFIVHYVYSARLPRPLMMEQRSAMMSLCRTAQIKPEAENRLSAQQQQLDEVVNAFRVRVTPLDTVDLPILAFIRDCPVRTTGALANNSQE